MGGTDRVSGLISGIQDKKEQTRVLIDLFFVSVLLDAGAGDVWQFREPQSGFSCGRSEGIALASLYMFKAGVFSSNSDVPMSVDGMFFLRLRSEGNVRVNSDFQCRPGISQLEQGAILVLFPNLRSESYGRHRFATSIATGRRKVSTCLA